MPEKKSRFAVKIPLLTDGETEAERGKSSCLKSNNRDTEVKALQFPSGSHICGPGPVRYRLASPQSLKDPREARAGGRALEMLQAVQGQASAQRGSAAAKIPHPGLTPRNSVALVAPGRAPSTVNPAKLEAS